MIELLAPMPLSSWADTKETLHRYLQVVGKIRLSASPRRNHWWNVPFHLTGRGVTSRPMGLVDGNPIFTIDFDFVGHHLIVQGLDGEAVSFPLAGRSVASFYHQTLGALAALGVKVHIDHPHPFDLPDAARPFQDDTEHAAYDPAQVTRYWQLLSQVNLILEEFAGRFSGKVSPVHHFWHTFDIAHTRFSDRRVDQPADVDPVTREAYSREVISFGFWFGDTADARTGLLLLHRPRTRRPHRRATTAGRRPLDAARRQPPRGTPAARHPGQSRPAGTVLDFYESAYRAGATRAGWDIDRLACPHGITDPQLAPSPAATS